jgi:hypothetical protein
MEVILEWANQSKGELNSFHEIRASLNNKIIGLTAPDAMGTNSRDLVSVLRSEINDLENILNTYNERILIVTRLYDRANKESTLVSENYEKMEECIETIRSEIKDLTKKLYSLSTLEMDYYDKLLMVYEKDGCEQYKQDYDEYRNNLGMIHRRDQYYVFKLTVDNMIIGTMSLICKFISIMENKDNTNEISKLWGDDRHRSY